MSSLLPALEHLESQHLLFTINELHLQEHPLQISCHCLLSEQKKTEESDINPAETVQRHSHNPEGPNSELQSSMFLDAELQMRNDEVGSKL